MYWEITKDVLYETSWAEGDIDPSEASAVGVCGPNGAVKPAALPVRFRLLDGDNEVYYVGRADSDDAVEMALYGYGTPNAGCAFAQIWQNGKGGGWKDFI